MSDIQNSGPAIAGFPFPLPVPPAPFLPAVLPPVLPPPVLLPISFYERVKKISYEALRDFTVVHSIGFALTTFIPHPLGLPIPTQIQKLELTSLIVASCSLPLVFFTLCEGKYQTSFKHFASFALNVVLLKGIIALNLQSDFMKA